MGHDDYGFPFDPILEWRTLVHVCQRWRYLIFASPLSLDLQLLCTYRTPVRRILGYWPPLPLIVDYYMDLDADEGKSVIPSYEDDIIAALEHADRVRYVGVSVTSSLLEKMAAVTQEPFPILTHLWLTSKDGDVPVLHETFFGGSVPRLRVARFDGIPFPELPTLLLSATDLVELQLINIPKTGYISPEAMVAGLSVLPRLETLSIGIQSPTSFPERRCRPPPTRVIFPSLSTFTFQGVNKYLENFVAHIDTPLLKHLTIVYFNQLVNFYIPQLYHLITHTESLALPRLKHARVVFGESSVFVSLSEGQVDPESHECHFAFQISCQWFDWQIWHMTQMLYQYSAALSHVENLSIGTYDLHPLWRADKYVEPSEWPGLLCSFGGVKILRVFKQLAGHVALALEDITGEKIAGTLPALHSLYLEGQPEASVAQYIAKRKISGHPVNVLNAHE
jgi:hypothetical protein